MTHVSTIWNIPQIETFLFAPDSPPKHEHIEYEHGRYRKVPANVHRKRIHSESNNWARDVTTLKLRAASAVPFRSMSLHRGCVIMYRKETVAIVMNLFKSSLTKMCMRSGVHSGSMRGRLVLNHSSWQQLEESWGLRLWPCMHPNRTRTASN